MKKPPHQQSDTHPADRDLRLDSLAFDNPESDPPSDSLAFDNRYADEYSSAQSGGSVGIFLMGFLAAVLLGVLAYFLVIRPQGQNAIVRTALSSDQTGPGGGGLVNAMGLSLEAQHPDGTVLRVEGIWFNSNQTTVQLTVTNIRDPGDGLIRLNQSWGSIRSTMILKDGLGGEYPLIAPVGNADFEVNPGQTITGEFAFSGKMNPATQTVTLVTNSKGGSPTHPILQTPLIEIEIPVNSPYP